VILLVTVPLLFFSVLFGLNWIKMQNPDYYYNTHWCYNRLMYINAGKEQYKVAKDLTNGVSVLWSDISPYVRTSDIYCLNEGTYTLGRIGESPACSLHGVYTNWKYNKK